MFKRIGQERYKRIRENGEVFDIIDVIGRGQCRAPLFRLCKTKCEGLEYIDINGHRYCSHPVGLRFEKEK